MSRQAAGVGEVRRKINIYCDSFRNELHSSEKRQYSGSLVTALAVTSSLVRGGPERVIHAIYIIFSENGLQG